MNKPQDLRFFLILALIFEVPPPSVPLENFNNIFKDEIIKQVAIHQKITQKKKFSG